MDDTPRLAPGGSASVVEGPRGTALSLVAARFDSDPHIIQMAGRP